MTSNPGDDAESQPRSEKLVTADELLAPSYRHDYAGRCWWCGRMADSGEHKYKRTDLIRAFGKGPWKGQSAVTQVSGEQQWDVQSPGARRLKFSRVFCGDCNSNRSQGFDFAYETFADYAIHERTRILERGEFCWSDIFGRQWKDDRNLVTAYWMKHIGCRFADGGVRVDPGIIAYLDSPGQLRGVPLHMQLQLREDWLEVAEHMESHGEDLSAFNALWMGGLMCFYSRSRELIHRATGDFGVGWVGLVYQFDLDYSRLDTNFWTDRVRLARYSSVARGMAAQNCKLCN